MSPASLFSDERCIERRETVTVAMFTTRGLMTRVQPVTPCCEKLSWMAPKPGRFCGVKPRSLLKE